MGEETSLGIDKVCLEPALSVLYHVLEERASHPEFSVVEDMDDWIWRGSMSTIVSGWHADPVRFYRTYQQTYVER